MSTGHFPGNVASEKSPWSSLPSRSGKSFTLRLGGIAIGSFEDHSTSLLLDMLKELLGELRTLEGSEQPPLLNTVEHIQ